MEKHESEKIIKETIEYANREIQKIKRKSRRMIGGVLLGMLIFLLAGTMAVRCELPVAYREGLVEVKIPVDQGIDIHVQLKNYRRANAVLVKNGEGDVDLYIGVMQTAATKLLPDFDAHNNFLRVGNGLVYDHQGERLQGFLPEGRDEEAIRRIYYVDDLSEQVRVLPDKELTALEGKTLIWQRED